MFLLPSLTSQDIPEPEILPVCNVLLVFNSCFRVAYPRAEHPFQLLLDLSLIISKKKTLLKPERFFFGYQISSCLSIKAI